MKTVDDVQSWLHSVGFERFCEDFIDHEIDGEVLLELDASDLSRMKLPLGPAKKLLRKISELRDGTTHALTHATHERSTQATTTETRGQIDSRDEPRSLQWAERRQVTVMFCDLVGSTSLANQFDPEDLSTILLSFRDLCSKIVVEFDGFIARYLGDGLLVYFGYPSARENDAERAIHVARAIIDAVPDLKPFPDLNLQARIGIATGMVVGGESGGEDSPLESVVMGETPNLAARLQGIAAPNTIVISDTTRQLVGPVFEYLSEELHQLKGFDSPVPTFTVSRENDSLIRFNRQHGSDLHPIVGRENEISLILERWHQTCDGDGQLVVLSGEPGFGKSRLAREVIDNINRAGDATIVYLQCSPYHSHSSLYPITHHLAMAAAFARDDTEEDRHRKLTALLADSGEFDDDALALICHLFGITTPATTAIAMMSSPQIRVRTLQCLIDLFIASARQKPVLLLLEDIHWIDPTTRQLVEQSLDRVERERTMILATGRPGQGPDFTAHPISTRLTLNRLGRKPVKQIIDAIGKDINFPPHIVEEILAKTDGVPLFAEEMTKAVIESRALIKQDDSPDDLTIPIQRLAVPSSLQDSLMERLDRLSIVKEFAQVASVIGREFGFALLAATLDRPDDEVAAAMDQLVSAGLLSSRGVAPESTYSFKHTLIRDTAYDSLVKRRRQHWHSRVALAIEKHQPERLRFEPELAAQHFSDAGLTKPAVRYWTAAAELSLSLFNNQEATIKAARGLAEVTELPTTDDSKRLALRLHMVRALSLRSMGGFTVPESVASFTSAIRLSKELNDQTVYTNATRGLCVARYLTGELTEARKLAESMVTPDADLEHRLNGHLTLGQVLCYLGYPVKARVHLQNSLDIINKQGIAKDHSGLTHQMDTLCVVDQFMQQTLDLQCRFDDAIAVANEGVERARKVAQPFAMAATLTHQCLTQLRLRLPLKTSSAELQKITSEYGMEFWGAWALFCSSMTHRHDGELTTSIVGVEAAKKRLEGLNVRLAITTILSAQAEMHYQLNQIDDGLQIIDEALGIVEATEEAYNLSELHRIRALLLRGGGASSDDVATGFQTAIKVSREQQAPLWELRARTSQLLHADDPLIRDPLRNELATLRNTVQGNTCSYPDLMDADAALTA